MDYGQHSEISLCKQANFIKIFNQFVTSQETIQIITHHHVKDYFSKLLEFATFQQNRQASGNTIQICREGQSYLNDTAVK